MGKVIELENLLEVIKVIKSENKTLITTNGCFDIIHVGHVRYLKQAKQLGDILIIALNTDYSVKQLKGSSRPINNENDRAEILASLNPVDYVILFNEETPANLLKSIKPDIHVKGGDYDINTLPESKVIQEAGGKIVFMPLVDGKSTTSIIEKANINCISKL